MFICWKVLNLSKKTDLKKIPGIGEQIKQDLIALGYTNVESLKNQNPEDLYNRLQEYNGCHVDRCMLYVFRCAVYYANTDIKNQEPDKLKWWNWKD